MERNVMKNPYLNAVSFHYVLLDCYKRLGITETGLSVILMIDHLIEQGNTFINSDMLIRKASYPADLATGEDIKDLPEMVCRGGSCIIDPYGHYVTEPVWDEESLIIADLDMTLPAACKMEHDAVGHYARPDVLELIVHE